MRRRVLFSIAYRGGPFKGWAKQPGLPTVQACVESALDELLGGGHGGAVVSSRTDAGVHGACVHLSHSSDASDSPCADQRFATPSMSTSISHTPPPNWLAA